MARVAGRGERRHVFSGPVLRPTARLSPRYPLLWAMGFLVSHWVRCPPPLLSLSPLESTRSGGVIPPPPHNKRGISAILARYHMKTRQNGCDTPFALLSRKGIARYSVSAPLCCKNMCCASRFCTGGREAGGSRSENLLERP